MSRDRFIRRKCAEDGIQYEMDHAEPCEVCGGQKWIFWCVKHGRSAARQGCEDCAYRLMGQLYLVPRELGVALLRNRRAGKKALQVYPASGWLADGWDDEAMAAKVRAAEQDDLLLPDDRHTLVAMLLRGDDLESDEEKRSEYDRLIAVRDAIQRERLEEAERRRKEAERRRLEAAAEVRAERERAAETRRRAANVLRREKLKRKVAGACLWLLFVGLCGSGVIWLVSSHERLTTTLHHDGDGTHAQQGPAPLGPASQTTSSPASTSTEGASAPTAPGSGSPAAPSSRKKLLVPEQFSRIQAAIDAARPGDTVWVRAGGYEGPLTFKEGIILVGEGMDRTFVRGSIQNGTVLTVKGCQSGWISDLAFEHTGVMNTAYIAHGMHLERSSVEVRRCRVRHANSSGIVCDKQDRSTVRDCEVSSCSDAGILVIGPGTTPLLIGNRAFANRRFGISFQQQAAGRAEANVCENNLESGILATDVQTAPVVVDNQTRRNGHSGIGFQAGAAGRAEGNVSENNIYSGFTVMGAGTAPALVNNVARSNKTSGIIFQDGAAGRAEANVCENNLESGLAASGIGTAPTLKKNEARRNHRSGIEFQKGAVGLAEANVCEDNEVAGIAVRNLTTAPTLRTNRCLKNAVGIAVIGANVSPKIAADNVLSDNRQGTIMRFK